MPQSTLLGWLGKPANLQVPPPAKLSGGRDDLDASVSPQTPSSSPLKEFKPISVDDTADKANPSNGIVKIKDRALPPNFEIRSCTKDDITNLKRLTGLLIPIPYPEKFYREIVEDPATSNITLVAVWHDNPSAVGKEKGLLVGAIRCRLLAYPPTPNTSPTLTKEGPMLYLSTLALLSPYRTHGIATHMLNMLTKRAVRDYGITSVGAHVWEANLEGLEWYRKRGFREVGREEGYYRRLKPTTAIVMQRQVGVMDLVGG
jgi:ribosomal protein S18 acetylase RimI-like enzyme